jgi:hypothetical protein
MNVHSWLWLKSSGEPDAGNPHVRFDEGEGSHHSDDSLSTLPVKKPIPHPLTKTVLYFRKIQYFRTILHPEPPDIIR